ncbi:MAG: PadR family transcriptional regulator [Nocardioides sp.]|uniref:PadR family transcriptional regulator n=1 Tax=Nocardioides sp. TaxID=35761 RepID=UPI0039E2C2AB
MSVRNGLLALLSEQPMYGAQLRTEFESRTGDTWPLNIGQVYSTLQRLERDGLVVQGGAAGTGAPTDPKAIPYSLTDAGRDEVVQWWDTALPTTPDPRDELTIKLALAVTVPGVDVADLVQRQRAAAMAHLQELTRAKRTGSGRESLSLAAELVLERRIFDAEALVRWLDHIEGRLAAQPADTRSTTKETIA